MRTRNEQGLGDLGPIPNPAIGVVKIAPATTQRVPTVYQCAGCNYGWVEYVDPKHRALCPECGLPQGRQTRQTPRHESSSQTIDPAALVTQIGEALDTALQLLSVFNESATKTTFGQRKVDRMMVWAVLEHEVSPKVAEALERIRQLHVIHT